jgi:hypothetical protein
LMIVGFIHVKFGGKWGDYSGSKSMY